jgi:hypothetical protein
MTKEQVVMMMVEKINNDNRLAAVNQEGVKLADLEKYILEMEPQLLHMCGGLYDTLASKGVINFDA